MAHDDNAKQEYLDALALCGIKADAMRAAGIARYETLTKWAKTDEEFAAGQQEAIEQAADGLESEARRRAVQGVLRQRMIGSGENALLIEEYVYSDALLGQLLKANKPEKFAERSKSEFSTPPDRPIEINSIATGVRLIALLDEAKRRKDEEDLFS